MDDLGEVVCNSGISAMFRSCVAWDNCFVTVARKKIAMVFHGSMGRLVCHGVQ